MRPPKCPVMQSVYNACRWLLLQGPTPLHAAAHIHAESVAKLLLDAGADTRAVDRQVSFTPAAKNHVHSHSARGSCFAHSVKGAGCVTNDARSGFNHMS